MQRRAQRDDRWRLAAKGIPLTEVWPECLSPIGGQDDPDGTLKKQAAKISEEPHELLRWRICGRTSSPS